MGSVPENVVKRARDAFFQRAPGEIAPLVSDSLIAEGVPGDSHRLTFQHPRATIDLRVSTAGTECLLQGRVEGVPATRATLHFEGSELAFVSSIEDTDFEFARVAHGIVRLSVEPFDDVALWTDWFQI